MTPPELVPGNEKSICVFIKKLRIEMELSQADLGLLLDASSSMINLFEAERHIGSKYHKLPDSNRWGLIIRILTTPLTEVHEMLRDKKEEKLNSMRASRLASGLVSQSFSKPAVPPRGDLRQQQETAKGRMEKIPEKVLLQSLSDRLGLPLKAKLGGVVTEVAPRRRLPNWSVGDLIREIKLHGFNSVTLSHDKEKEKTDMAAAQREVDLLFGIEEEEEEVPKEKVKRESMKVMRHRILSGIKKVEKVQHDRKRKNRQPARLGNQARP
jgi:hypothetical protein